MSAQPPVALAGLPGFVLPRTLLEGLPGRISSLAIGIGHLRARRAEQYDFTLQRLQGEANALRDEMWELFLTIAGVRDGGRAAPSLGPKIGRPKPAAVDSARLPPEPASRYKSRFLGGRY